MAHPGKKSRHYLSRNCALKRLEGPCVYDVAADELYELDEEAFGFLKRCADGGVEAGGGSDVEFIEYCLGEGILQTERPEAGAAQVVGGRSPMPSLRYLELQITRRCNLRCRHCFLGPQGPMDLPAGAVEEVLEEFQRMQGLRVLITGGEPLLHPAFREINELLPGFALRKILFTNGTAISPQALKGLNVHELQFSIDGLRGAHDHIRGAGTFDKAISAIREAAGAGLDVSVSTMVHARNLEDFPAMEDMFREMGVRDWSVDVPCALGNLKANAELALPPEIAGKYLSYGFGGGGLHGGAAGFACGHHLMAVTAGGKCAKCSFYANTPVGSLNEGLLRCWERVPRLSLRELECGCPQMDTCRGGCRFRAALMGSELGPDLYKCSSYDILF